MGRCPACGEWNTMVEAPVSDTRGHRGSGIGGSSTRSMRTAAPIPLSEIEALEEPRIKMPSAELNRVLGGGLVAGSIVLIGGEPGIGKSTLLLQNLLSIRGKRILYVSGEESAHQLKLRADRLGKGADNTLILCETDLDRIFDQIEKVGPQILVIDSIQTVSLSDVESSAGSVSQVRECAAALLRYAKESGVPVILVGHINKEGSIAGPKVLEHIVDTVLQFEGDAQYYYRILRAVKNRFGSTSEIGIYEMVTEGLREVSNPSEMLLSTHRGDGSTNGIAIGVTMEGHRAFMVEVQALVSGAAYGTPQRSVTGFDQRRLNMLLAVLEKRARFRLGQKDVFLNIVGGLKVADPALDMAVIVAVMSSNLDMNYPPRTVFIGEVGLSGEIRPVSRIEHRVAEAARLGYRSAYVPAGSIKDPGRFAIGIIQVDSISSLLHHLFDDAPAATDQNPR